MKRNIIQLNSKSIDLLNTLGKNRVPFFFAINYDLQEILILEASKESSEISFDIDGIKSVFQPHTNKLSQISNIRPILFEDYKIKFDILQQKISCGDTYLANLTAKTKIELNTTLADVYAGTNAPFKIWVKDRFVSFSPERFVKIYNNQIFTYPMKGTAAKDELCALMASKKELAEHTMVVDLLRNDLSLVAYSVRLKNFRVPKLLDGMGIWQTSSEIVGSLEQNWQANLGNIFAKLLPAGSITGTPKKMTIKILKDIENYNRGFFSGVFGYFSGNFLDSAVAIRFIEQTKDGFIYKSGGGITTDSNALSEYAELLAKIYLPIQSSRQQLI